MAQKRKTAQVKTKNKEDEGPRFIVTDWRERPVYLGEGVSEKEAQRLADGLVATAFIAPVDPTT